MMTDIRELSSTGFDNNIKSILLNFYYDKQLKILELLIFKTNKNYYMDKVKNTINNINKNIWCYSYHEYTFNYEYNDIFDNIIIIKTSY